ncbi:MAG: TonB-dependent receptor plug domain-containing protein, partial [Alistipes sp.]|nr:TonB-dependent receptor plug domain-containing protein [Alistipes sp.]
MKTSGQKERFVCFKRWSRDNYAVFASLHRYCKIGVLSVGMSIILHATAMAEEDLVDSTAVFKTMAIESVGVVGNKVNPTRSAMSQTTLFNRDRGAAAPVQTIESALRLSPAVDVRERGGKSVQADISIRGGSFDQTMVMLNGIDFTDARTGHQTHALPVDVDCVAGVELIDGVAGVGAYAGAVNVRTVPLRPTYLRLEAVGGQYGYAYGNLSGAVTEGRFTLFAAGSYRQSDGYIHNTDFTKSSAFLRMTYDDVRGGLFDVQAGYPSRAFG